MKPKNKAGYAEKCRRRAASRKTEQQSFPAATPPEQWFDIREWNDEARIRSNVLTANSATMGLAGFSLMGLMARAAAKRRNAAQ